MNISQTKRNLLKAIAVVGALSFGVVNFVQSSSQATSSTSLKELAKISNANAEGSISCGDAGSGCKFTLNGTAMTSTTHKEK